MLAVTILLNGGVRIEGTRRDLCELSAWLTQATQTGRAAPAFVTDQALTTVDIRCTDYED